MCISFVFSLPGYLGWRFHPLGCLHHFGSYWQHRSGKSVVAGDRGPGARYSNPIVRAVLTLHPAANCPEWADMSLIMLPGEFMQLGSKENENERFKHYLEKTFKKTASLIANSCKAVCTFRVHTDMTEPEKSLGFHA